MTQKFCRRCFKALPLDEFHNKTDSKDGKQAYCKKCIAEYQKSRDTALEDKFTCYEIIPGVKVYKRKY